MRDRSWLPYAGVAVVFGILAGATYSVAAVSDACAALAGLSALGAVILLVARNRRDPYSFEALREVQEQAELDEIEVPEPEDYDSVHCLCGAVYNRRLPVCPRCRRSQHSACMGP